MLVVVVFVVLAWPGGNDCCGYYAAATTAAASTSSTATERNVFRLPKVAAEDDPKAAPCETPDLAVPRQSPSPLVMKNVPQLLAASQPLREAVTVNGIYAHLEQFQAIADAQTPHVRSSGSQGARASVQYIVSQLVQAGYQRDVDIQLQEFPVSRDEQGVNIICNLDPNVAAANNAASDDNDNRKVVIVGAHVDSVPEGPGINDNGSGAATVLELAIQMRRQLLLRQQPLNNNSMLRPTTTSNTIVRFIWFGAEEVGLVGAQYYVDQVLLKENAKEDKLLSTTIQAMLNFDMLASPNYARFVYDGDGSDHPDSGPGPDGSHIIERVFLDYFDHQGLAAEAVPLGAFSDYFPFAVESVPVGGVFSGHSWKKTRAQVSKFGGIAGRAFDFCYHAACDDLDNINVQALQELSQAAAHGVWTFYQSGDSLLSLSASSSSTTSASENDGVVVQATNNNNANDRAVMEPTGSPTSAPSQSPTVAPSQSPTSAPSQSPTLKPSTKSPTSQPPFSNDNMSSSPTVLPVVTSNSLMTTTNTMDDSSSSSSQKETPPSPPSSAAAAAAHSVQTHDESPSSHGDSSSSHSHDGSTRARVLTWGLNVLLAVWLVAVALGCY